MSPEITPQIEPVPIGEFAEPDFVRLPEPVALFRARADRLRALSATHTLAPYLVFLAELAAIQERIAASLPSPKPLSPEELEAAVADTRAPLDRLLFVPDEFALAVSDKLLAALADVAIPEAAVQAVGRLKAADAATRQAALQHTLRTLPVAEVLAEHALLSAALQVVFAAAAATLPPQRLQPVADGVCPVCGSPPLASLLAGWQGARGTRYCACGLCGTFWNYVRIKCTLCGSTKGIAYHGIEGDAGTIKAESCESCRRYVKILYQQKDPALEPMADDIGSLGLDLLMREAGFARGAVNPFLLGY
ncbi:MAG: formate dehydrogenase accessory protein FdhE [Alphaproteobacteria bacterium]|nr:formate dehydrogenase accessory protein FdhE [Alphaproteobacteria bacterium]